MYVQIFSTLLRNNYVIWNGMSHFSCGRGLIYFCFFSREGSLDTDENLQQDRLFPGIRLNKLALMSDKSARNLPYQVPGKIPKKTKKG